MQRAFLEAIGDDSGARRERKIPQIPSPKTKPQWSRPNISTSGHGTRVRGPCFPREATSGGTPPAYRNGHWINGRLAVPSLADAAAQILEDADVTEFNAAELDDSLEGAIASGKRIPKSPTRSPRRRMVLRRPSNETDESSSDDETEPKTPSESKRQKISSPPSTTTKPKDSKSYGRTRARLHTPLDSHISTPKTTISPPPPKPDSPTQTRETSFSQDQFPPP